MKHDMIMAWIWMLMGAVSIIFLGSGASGMVAVAIAIMYIKVSEIKEKLDEFNSTRT